MQPQLGGRGRGAAPVPQPAPERDAEAGVQRFEQPGRPAGRVLRAEQTGGQRRVDGLAETAKSQAQAFGELSGSAKVMREMLELEMAIARRPDGGFRIAIRKLIAETA